MFQFSILYISVIFCIALVVKIYKIWADKIYKILKSGTVQEMWIAQNDVRKRHSD